MNVTCQCLGSHEEQEPNMSSSEFDIRCRWLRVKHHSSQKDLFMASSVAKTTGLHSDKEQGAAFVDIQRQKTRN